jgi:TolB-like protein
MIPADQNTDGLTEELLNALAKHRSAVASHQRVHSGRTYRWTRRARRVANVLEGGVRRRAADP